MKRKKRWSLALALVLLLLLCAGCGSTGDATTDSWESEANYEPAEAWDAGDWDGEIQATTRSGLGVGGSADYAAQLEENAAYTSQNAKLIYTAYLTVETLEFDDAVNTLHLLVQSYGGYYGSSDVWSYGGDENAIRTGEYVIRVPQNAYNAFMNHVGDVGNIIRRSESTQDVGDEYYDTELRLQTLKTKHERLLALLAQATDMESIITLQGYLSEVEYEIDRYSGTLRRYDSLVDYATISISLQEKTKLTTEPGEKASFGAQVGSAFSQSFGNFGAGLQRLSIWLAYHFVALILVVALVCVGLVIGRKQWKARRKEIPAVGKVSEEPKEPPSAPEA